MTRVRRSLVVALVLSALAINGALSAVLATFYLPWRVGVVPLPVSAVVSGALNVALVAVAMRWTRSSRLAAVPLWSWLGTVAVLSLAAPGDDILFGGVGVMNLMPLVLLAVAVGPAAWLLWRSPPVGARRSADIRRGD